MAIFIIMSDSASILATEIWVRKMHFSLVVLGDPGNTPDETTVAATGILHIHHS